MNLVQIVAVRSFGRSSTPPHHIDPCAGVATHTRLTFAATPKPGTFNVKYGGNAEGVVPAISRRTPSWLTSTIVDNTPSIDDIRFGTSVARRSPRRTSFGQRQRDGQQECIARHRTIDPCRIARYVLDRIPWIANHEERPVRAEHLGDAGQLGFWDELNVGDQRLNRPRRQIATNAVDRQHWYWFIPGQAQPFEKGRPLAGNRARDANFDRIGSRHRHHNGARRLPRKIGRFLTFASFEYFTAITFPKRNRQFSSYFSRCRSASAAMNPKAFQPAPETIRSKTARALAVSPVTR